MNSAPSTPVLKRKSSKKIIIASPSQELLHFLTLPNPQAQYDPRERLHILTPKSHNRSFSHPKPQQKPMKVQPKPIDAATKLRLVRKKASECSWGKMSMQVRCSKLRLSDKGQRKVELSHVEKENLLMKSNCRLQYTFGLGRSWACLQAQ